MNKTIYTFCLLEWKVITVNITSFSGVLYFCNSTINPILYNLMSKKFRLAFKRTLCRCWYTSEELLELNSKSKSVYCSGHYPRNTANHVTKMSYTDLNGTKLHGGMFKQDGLRDMSAVSGGHTCSRCCYSPSQDRSNEVTSDSDKSLLCVGSNCNGLGPRAVGLRYQNSVNSSLVSFCDLESDSVVEMKSLSSGSSTNLLSAKFLTVPIRSYHLKRGSFV